MAIAFVQAAQPVALTPASPRLRTPVLVMSTTLDTIRLTFQRPTTATPLAWPASSTIRVSIVLVLDGQEHRCSAEYVGGVQKDPFTGLERPEDFLSYSPTTGFFGGTARQKRLGETGIALTGYLEFVLLSGAVMQTTVSAVATEAPAPTEPWHGSVAFDNSTGGAGSGTSLSFSHTASGSNLGVWVGNASNNGVSSTATYGGTDITVNELSDDAHSGGQFQHAAYWATEVTTALSGTKTVVSTFSTGSTSNAMHVISMTGVHQTAPVGTVFHGAAFGGAADLAVTGVGVNDLVVDSILWNAAVAATVGADQTAAPATTTLEATVFLQSSNQLGSVESTANMTWTTVATVAAHLAIAFKPAAAGGTGVISTGGATLNTGLRIPILARFP